MEVNEIKNTAVETTIPPLLPKPSASVPEGESPQGVSNDHIGRDLDSAKANVKDNNKEQNKDLLEALRDINKAIEVKGIRNVYLNYSIDEATSDIVVKVLEKDTDKLIRQIPPDEILKLRGHLKELLGVIFDENG